MVSCIQRPARAQGVRWRVGGVPLHLKLRGASREHGEEVTSISWTLWDEKTDVGPTRGTA